VINNLPHDTSHHRAVKPRRPAAGWIGGKRQLAETIVRRIADAA
jgi:hypothetical protein